MQSINEKGENMKKILAVLLCATMIAMLVAACAQDPGPTDVAPPPANDTAPAADSEDTTADAPAPSRDVVQLIYPTYQAGAQPEAEFFARVIEEFNRQYEGVYEVIIEEHPPDIPMFLERMNMLFAADDLPVIVHPLMQDRLLTERIFDAGLAVDLAPYINADPVWKENLIPSSLEAQTRPDGQIFSQPLAYYSPIVFFYNTELFAQAGVDKFPETMDEFWAVLDQMKASGVTPFLLPTEGAAFPSLALLSWLIGRTEEGRQLMNTNIPENFSIPAVVDAFTDLRRMFDYAAPESVGSVGPDKLNAFRAAEKTAMYNMGAWIMGAFFPPDAAEDFADKLAVAPFPGGIALDHDSRGYSRCIINTYPDDQIEAAIELFRFFASDWFIREIMVDQGAVPATYRPTDEDYSRMSSVAAEYIRTATSDQFKYVYPQYQVNWDPYTVNTGAPPLLAMLANDEITPEEAADMLTESVIFYFENVD